MGNKRPPIKTVEHDGKRYKILHPERAVVVRGGAVKDPHDLEGKSLKGPWVDPVKARPWIEAEEKKKAEAAKKKKGAKAKGKSK